MLKKIRIPVVAAAVLLLAGLPLARPAAASEEGEQKVQVHKIVLDKGDGEPGEHKVMVFTGEDGEHHVMHGGEGHVWVGAGEHGHHAIHMHGAKGGFLGVELTELTPELRTHFGAPEGAGVLVAKVVEDSPAARAGIRVGDILSAVDGEEVASAGALAHAIRGHGEGDVVSLDAWRDGNLVTLTATLEEREGMARMMKRQVMVECAEGGEDCDVKVLGGHHAMHGLHGFDCGGAEKCEIQVRCGDDGCTCLVNGEAAECEALPGFAEHHGK